VRTRTVERLRPREAPAKVCPPKKPIFGLKKPKFFDRLALEKPISDKGGHVYVQNKCKRVMRTGKRDAKKELEELNSGKQGTKPLHQAAVARFG
jgi:hypothetical protein